MEQIEVPVNPTEALMNGGQTMVQIPAELANATIRYLATCPYGAVAGLIQMWQALVEEE